MTFTMESIEFEEHQLLIVLAAFQTNEQYDISY